MPRICLPLRCALALAADTACRAPEVLDVVIYQEMMPGSQGVRELSRGLRSTKIEVSHVDS